MAGAVARWLRRGRLGQACVAIGDRIGIPTSLRIAIAVLLIATSPQTSLAQTASLPGKSGVGASGSATYAVPISVPPGTAGMSPSLSLEYNNQSGASSGWLGAGIVGVGWSLGGLPAVGRCPRTVAQDGVSGAVNYDANDRFCLDGQRLIAISGAYGADGTEYRTEIESFSRVISHGTAGTGPAWFEVRSKSGQILQFGNTTDSRILAQGKTTARSWGVNKVSDTKGNYFTVTYVNDTVNGQAYPSRIDYTANDAASLAAYNSVRFVYDTSRADVLPIYHAGSLIKTTVRLANVQTYAGSALVADYRLAYQQSSASGRSQVASITLCDGAANCLPATAFTWQTGGLTPTVVANVAGQDGTLVLRGGTISAAPYVGDFNGDGLPDIMWNYEPPSAPSSDGTRVLWTNTGGGGFSVNGNFANQNNSLIGYAPIVGDFNRDGRSDVWWYQLAGDGTAAGPTTTWLSTAGSGFTIAAGTAAPTGSFQYVPAGVVDINGDYRSDLLWYQVSVANLTAWTTNPNGTVTTTSAGPTGGFLGRPAGIGGSTSFSRSADFNGDGRADLLWTSPTAGALALWLGVGDGTFTQFSGADASVAGYTANFVDINGDGKTDVFWDKADSSGRSTGLRIIWMSRGDGTFDVNANAGGQNGTLTGYTANFGDLNGDGLIDILWVQTDTNGLSTGARVAWIGKGDGTFTVVSNYGGQDGTLVGYMPILVDFNGDGKTDVLWDSRTAADPLHTSGTRVFWLSDGVSPDVITTVTSGVGATVTFTYRPLTDSTVYTKDNTATDPVVDVQMPMQVVSRIDASNGIGGTLATGYAYVGAKLHEDGRGFLGFRQLKVTDLQTNIVQTTTYRQDYPYLYLASSDTQTLGAVTLSATTNTHGSTSLGGTRYQVFLSQTQTAKNDLEGTALPTATASYQYDAYNNATQVIASTSDGYSKTTANTYTNDATNWLLGRLTASNVTAQAPQQLGQYCSLPWGGTIANGQSVTAYSAVNPPAGQVCSAVAQTRTCNNGTLSGSNTQQTCSLLACTLPWGGSIASGQSVTAYSAASPAVGQACSAIAQTRTCTNASLSGGFAQQSCTPLSCTLPWGGSIGDGQSVTAYSAANPPAGQACTSIAQTRTCSLGALSGSNLQQSCTAVCALPWGGTINQGQSVTAYSAGGVPTPQVCSSIAQTRTCGVTGVLSGSSTFQSCVVRQPKTVFLTTGSSWTVPADLNNAINKVEVIGGGGDGGVVYATGGGGAGGGAYSTKSNVALTPGSSVSYNVGLGGTGGYSAPGGNTWFNGTSLGSALVSAQGGAGGLNNTVGTVLGGQAANGIGTTRYSGGNGGSGNLGGGGGGGAAGPHGNGGAGGNYAGGRSDTGGGGGGGADGGSAGGNDNGTVSGNGGNSWQGNGGGLGNCNTGGAPYNGGGGSGGAGFACGGGSGSMASTFDSTHGSGGGGGGGGSSNPSPGRPGGAGVGYGGGGGGGGAINANGGPGGNGIIVITYTPGS
jgi:hypothetical protein